MIDKVYLKITTIPQTEDLKTTDKEFELYFDKYEDAKSLTTNNKILESYYTSAGLNPLFGKIHSATVGFLSEGNLRVQVLTGEEKDILIELINLFNNHFSESTMVGWNFSFLLPFVTTRMMKYRINMVNVPKCFKHLGLQKWKLTHNLDLQSHIEGVGWFKSSLEQHAFNLGLETNMINPEDTYKYVKDKQFDIINKSDIDYIFTLANVDSLSSGGNEIKDISSAVRDLNEEETKVEEKSLLDRVETVGLSRDIVEDIKNTVKGKKLTKKEKENLVDILLSKYQIKGDKKAEKLTKKKQITDLINTL